MLFLLTINLTKYLLVWPFKILVNQTTTNFFWLNCRPFTAEVLSLQVPPMLEPGLVQRTPPPVKPKPRTVKSAEVQEACCINFNILVLLNRT